MSIEKRSFGKLQDGTEAYIFKLANSQNMAVEITNFGGIILSIKVPDKKGKICDVVLGYEKLEAYTVKGPYFGAVIGRHGNRIEDSRFELDGVEYQLARNDGKNHLHGGNKGFDKVMWQAEVISKPDVQSLQLTYRSKDGEENYPGNLDVKVNYTLTDENELKIDYFAVSDKKTVVNLTNHTYFNLSGHDSGDILKHELKIYADKFTVIDAEGIPTGEIRDVRNTPMDFSDFTPVGLRIDADDEQINCGKGYDHNWALNAGGNGLEKAAEVYDPDSGRFMEVYTTKPGIQFYSANFLTGSDIGKGGAVYNKRSGLCLETQYFPNALNHKHFPSPILEAGSEYAHTTVYRFTNVK